MKSVVPARMGRGARGVVRGVVRGVGALVACGALLSTALSTAACDEEQLVVLVPRITLCPAADAPEDACDDTVDLGRIVVGAPHETAVFVVNRGDGALVVSEATVADVSITGATLDVGAVPDRVGAGNGSPVPLTVTLPEDALGPGSAVLTVTSSDGERPSASVTVTWEGIPPRRGDVLLCDGANPEALCDTRIDIDFGVVRPTQTTSRLVLVRNGGETELEVQELRIEGANADDFALASSTQSALLDPGAEGGVVVVFTGNGVGARTAELVVVTDDPDTAEARATLRGTVGDNALPTAVAVESVTGATTATALAAQLVGVDGTGSSDPEGDPLAFTWTLAAPAGSAATIEEPSAQNALFTPDVRGLYTVTLVVADSIGQESAPAVVTVDVLARFAVRARVRWASGGDVDVHLVESGSAPFSARDARFDNRVVAAGSAASALDDAVLLDDDTAGPGVEDVVIEQPAAGTWEVWAALFDDAGLGAVDVDVDVIFDDAAPAALTLTETLPATCALWHAATLTIAADGTTTVVDANAAVTTQCP